MVPEVSLTGQSFYHIGLYSLNRPHLCTPCRQCALKDSTNNLVLGRMWSLCMCVLETRVSCAKTAVEGSMY